MADEVVLPAIFLFKACNELLDKHRVTWGTYGSNKTLHVPWELLILGATDDASMRIE